MLGQEVRYRYLEEGCTMKQTMETTKELRKLASEVVSSHCQIDNSATCLVATLYGHGVKEARASAPPPPAASVLSALATSTISPSSSASSMNSSSSDEDTSE